VVTSRYDVLVAPATPWGYSALAIVRLSGEGTHALIARFLRPISKRPLAVGGPRRVEVFDADGVFDDGVVLLGGAPATFTGDDTAELTVHGNPLIVERVLAAATAAGATLAGPGSFTRRAVANGKLDLVRAEAVLQVSSARSYAGLAVARDAASGRVSEALSALRARLLESGAELEARLDYPGDELALIDDDALCDALSAVAERCEALAGTVPVGERLIGGARVALVGAVNAGKSSLFNALVGRTRALVHATPGTTRDVLETQIVRGGLAFTLLDTAGERPTDDPVEAAGLALARELVDEADAVVVVLRARASGLSEVERMLLARTADRARVVVVNGVDEAEPVGVPASAVRTAAPLGQGVEELVAALKQVLTGEALGHSALVLASARQRQQLERAGEAAREAAELLALAGPAVAAERVIEALEALDELTGQRPREAVLDALFARFCIGK